MSGSEDRPPRSGHRSEHGFTTQEHRGDRRLRASPPPGGVAHANTSHEGWPKIDGVLKINKDDGNETMSGTAKSDELLGGHDSDTIYGRDSADVLWGDYKPSGQGTAQVDHLYGGAGSDFIYASHGRTSSSRAPATTPSTPTSAAAASTAAPGATRCSSATAASPATRSATARRSASRRSATRIEGVRLEGIHHITAITGDAPRNVDFYTRVLGLRLVAKTVNQDDPSVYHLFYADEPGRPGAELTFFEYPRAIPGRAGAGMVHRIVSRVGLRGGAGLLGRAPRRRGRRRTSATATACASPTPRASATSSSVRAGGDTPLVAEHPEIPAELALQGFDGVRAYSAQPRAQRPRARAAARRHAAGRGHLGAARRGPRRRPSPTTRRRPSPAARARAPSITSPGARPSPSTRAGRSTCATPACRPRASSTATTSTRSTSASPAASCSRSPTTGPASRSTATASSELGSTIILPPQLEPQRERIEAILTPLPDPRAERSPAR